MRTLCFAFALLLGCGSSGDDAPQDPDAAGGTGAQLRFQYDTSWATHLGCTSVADYRITFGATPIPVTASIDLTSNAPGAYVTVDGRTYADADVLHKFTCNGSSKQEFSRFGTDLALADGKQYTVTLTGTVATLVEDP